MFFFFLHTRPSPPIPCTSQAGWGKVGTSVYPETPRTFTPRQTCSGNLRRGDTQ